MTTTYTSRLRLALQGYLDNPETWGTVANAFVSMIEEAIAGMSSFSLAAGNITLSTANNSTDQARMAILNASGILPAAREIVVPAVSKFYLVYNNTTGAYSVTVKTAAGTGVTVTQGKAQWVWCDGTNVLASSVAHADAATTSTTASSATSVPNDTITYAMIQNMTTARILGRTTGGSGDIEELTAGSTLTLSGGSLSLNLGSSNAWTATQYVTPSALTSGTNISVNAALSNTFTLTIAHNATLDNPTNLANGMVLTFRIKQDGTGGRTLAYGTKYEFPGDVAPTITPTAGKMDVITGTYDSAADKLYCTISQNYSTT
jgi:hypothetical protein